MERLNQGMRTKLTLISASAGFGKTTLLSEWVAGCRQPVAWLSLDEADNDPARFLTYLVSALQTIVPNIGKHVLAVLQSPQFPATESLLTSLLNEMSAEPQELMLVLDDYHAIESKPVDNILAFMLGHLPANMHLVIATREDPAFPLTRLRAQAQLTELRAADLRFSPSEAAEFLNRVMGLELSGEDIAALETRTEGWIAGLQLAALSMQGHEDIGGFIQAFTGSHRFVLDYLVEEILQRQSEDIRCFLMQTSILERLCAGLCNAVTERENGKEMLAELERNNLFLIPLDEQRQWYRYHHLFSDVLQTHFMSEYSDQVASLHLRASVWYEKNGFPSDAIRHALAAKDFGRAADLIEKFFLTMSRNQQSAVVLGWLKALPDKVIYVRPVLSVAYALVSLTRGGLEGVESHLRNAERWMDMTEDINRRSEAQAAGMVIVDEEEFRRLPGMIALIRGARALARGDMPETVKYAQRAFDLATVDDYLTLGGAASQLGLAAWADGDLEVARRMTADGTANVRLAGYISSAIGGSIVLADIQIAQGCLHEAMTTYKRALQWATESGGLVLPGAADMHVGMSNLHYEHNDLITATQLLIESQAMGKLAELPQNPYRWHAAMARLQVAQGDLEGALDLLIQAERLYDGAFSPNLRPVATQKVRVWVAQGRLDEALDWAREHGLSVENEPSYLHEFDHITLARILLARYLSGHDDGSISGVMGLLERLLKAAEEGGRNGSVIEILVLQAILLHTKGDLTKALISLQHALELAEPEGYVRIFLDEGTKMQHLLTEASMLLIMPAYTKKLLTEFETSKTRNVSKPELSPANRLVEPLSAREIEILLLVAQGLSNKQIGERLFLALDTVKGHNRKIFDKLNVQSRTEAAARARELGLL